MSSFIASEYLLELTRDGHDELAIYQPQTPAETTSWHRHPGVTRIVHLHGQVLSHHLNTNLPGVLGNIDGNVNYQNRIAIHLRLLLAALRPIKCPRRLETGVLKTAMRTLSDEYWQRSSHNLTSTATSLTPNPPDDTRNHLFNLPNDLSTDILDTFIKNVIESPDLHANLQWQRFRATCKVFRLIGDYAVHRYMQKAIELLTNVLQKTEISHVDALREHCFKADIDVVALWRSHIAVLPEDKQTSRSPESYHVLLYLRCYRAIPIDTNPPERMQTAQQLEERIKEEQYRQAQMVPVYSHLPVDPANRANRANPANEVRVPEDISSRTRNGKAAIACRVRLKTRVQQWRVISGVAAKEGWSMI